MSHELNVRPEAMWRRAFKALRAMLPFARRSRRWFFWGCFAALAVVTARLALPWPLRAVTELWAPDAPPGGELLGVRIDDPVHYVFAMGVLFLLCILLLGLFDWLERLNFARFAIGMVRDMRAKAFWSAIGARAKDRSAKAGFAGDDETLDDDLGEMDEGNGASAPAGDMVARLVGDTARVKNGVQGFLVHVATNGVLLAGVTVVLFVMNVQLGLIFATASLATMVVAALAAGRMFRRSLRQRSKEGKLAEQIGQAFHREPSDARFVEINNSSGLHEAAQTQIQGFASFFAHIVFGLAVLAALWVGAQEVAAGRAVIGDLVVMMMYVLLLRGPFIRLARQGARTGKILGAASRLEQMLTAPPDASGPLGEMHLMPLRDGLRLNGVTLAGADAAMSAEKSRSIDIELKTGQRIAIVGPSGAGKTALLEAISGARPPKTGCILWDGQDLGGAGPEARAVQIAYVPRSPDEAALERRFSEFVGLIHRQACVWLFDGPTEQLPEHAAVHLLDALLGTTGPTIVIVATCRPAEADRFDRVIELDAGRVIFDGTPQRWRRAATEMSASPSCPAEPLGRIGGAKPSLRLLTSAKDSAAGGSRRVGG